MAFVTYPDPTENSLWRPLRMLQEAIAADISRVYAEAGVGGFKASFVMELLRLHARGPMTIAELAESVQRTHSAISQKVAAMRAAGLVRTTAGPDARSKRVVLTPKARRLVDRLGGATVMGGEKRKPPTRARGGDRGKHPREKAFRTGEGGVGPGSGYGRGGGRMR